MAVFIAKGGKGYLATLVKGAQALSARAACKKTDVGKY